LWCVSRVRGYPSIYSGVRRGAMSAIRVSPHHGPWIHRPWINGLDGLACMEASTKVMGVISGYLAPK
jgi:hypothetical protein